MESAGAKDYGIHVNRSQEVTVRWFIGTCGRRRFDWWLRLGADIISIAAVRVCDGRSRSTACSGSTRCTSSRPPSTDTAPAPLPVHVVARGVVLLVFRPGHVDGRLVDVGAGSASACSRIIRYARWPVAGCLRSTGSWRAGRRPAGLRRTGTGAPFAALRRSAHW